jgi:hypothetical protein
MKTILRNRNLYIINFALLFTHEIDSAYWQEWDIFGLPLGVQSFLIINFILFLLALGGLLLVIQHKREGLYFSLGLALLGSLISASHISMILDGANEFTLPVSMILLASVLIMSILQGAKATGSLWFSKHRIFSKIKQKQTSSS